MYVGKRNSLPRAGIDDDTPNGDKVLGQRARDGKNNEYDNVERNGGLPVHGVKVIKSI